MTNASATLLLSGLATGVNQGVRLCGLIAANRPDEERCRSRTRFHRYRRRRLRVDRLPRRCVGAICRQSQKEHSR